MLAQVMAAVTLVCVLIRVWQVFADAQDMAKLMTETSMTDALTALGNRRRLMAELQERIARINEPGSSERAALIMFDLNGFKTYNDTFGHTAGDDLLRRLAGKLSWTVELRGCAYRLGGDEFCVLLAADENLSSVVEEDLLRALSESGKGYEIDAAYGIVRIPDEARSVSEALRFADRRMYAQKAGGRASVGMQMRDVLVCALLERDASLGEHNDDVALYAQATALRLGLTGEQIDEITRCAELRDVGKVAIPDSILHKPDGLTVADCKTMELHTIVGERILGLMT